MQDRPESGQTRKSGRFSNLFGHKNRHTPVRWTARREYHVPNVSMAETTSRTVSNLNLCRQECLALIEVLDEKHILHCRYS